MKKFSVILFPLFFAYLHLEAQSLHDNNWVSGVNADAYKFSYTPDSILAENLNSPEYIEFGFSMSDSLGNFLFYSNGCKVINAVDNSVVTLSELNTSDPYWNISCANGDLGYPTVFGNVCLPSPTGQDRYVLFHEQFRDGASSLDLLYTTLQSKHGEHVTVETRNSPLLMGDTLADQMMAVKHGNGRDWWLLVPKFFSNHFYRFLLSPDGVSGPYMQEEGPVINHYYWCGQPSFSPDGKHYVRTVPREGAYLYDVDRCTGLLSFREVLVAKDTSYCVGASFSPDSRFLYVSPALNLYQFDLSSENVNNSRVLVAKYNGTTASNELWPCFLFHVLAPNGKIYITTCQGTKFLHVINRPNLPGEACDFVQRAIEVTGKYSYDIGSNVFPHYRLGKAVHSPCDSIGQPPLDAITLYPNPSGTQVQVYVPYGSGSCWEVFNTLGQFVGTFTPGEDRGIQLNVRQWPSGMYVIRGCSAEGAGFVKTFGVVR